MIIKAEDNFEISGCSKDKLTNFLLEYNQEYNIDFLDRTIFYFQQNNNIINKRNTELKEFIKNNNDIYFFDILNINSQISEFKPTIIQNTWLKKYLLS